MGNAVQGPVKVPRRHAAPPARPLGGASLHMCRMLLGRHVAVCFAAADEHGT